MTSNPFAPHYSIGRAVELQKIIDVLVQNGDFLLVGAPGVGRRTLIQAAAQHVGARILEIDCLCTTSATRFIQRLADSIMDAFIEPRGVALIQQWSVGQPLILEQSSSQRARLVWHPKSVKEWTLFQTLLALPQRLAELLDCRVVITFLNFPHIRSWDRSGEWETYLRQEIQRQNRVSYALVSTVLEPWVYDSPLQVISLAPLNDEDLKPWLVDAMAAKGLRFDPETQALELFLSYVQGHLGDAIALVRRVWMEYHASTGSQNSEGLIQAHHVHRSALAIIEDLAVTFEALILLLPPRQARVLESLSIEPTDRPQSREYTEKHQLARGGSLQGALISLEQKGLIYGAKYGYRVALPYLDLWLKHRIV